MKKILFLFLILSISTLTWGQNSKETIALMIKDVDFSVFENEKIVLNRKTFIVNGDWVNDHQIFNAESFSVVLHDDGMLLVDKFKKYYVAYSAIKTIVVWEKSFSIWLTE